MPRKKKEETLNEAEVYSVIEFAKNMYNTFTPQLVNQRLQDITLNPTQATQEKIERALQNPKNNEDNLIGFSEFFELTDMLYKRTLLYLGNMLSFDITYTCINAEFKDYDSPAYKKDIAKVYSFLDKFNCKQEFKKVVRQLVRQEEYYCIFRNDGEKFTLQELPQKYCLNTGRSDYGMLFDFNMYWFLQPGVSLDMYPNIFKKLYKKVFGGNTKAEYNPAASIDKRTGSYVYYVQTSPDDGFWSWKFNPDIQSRVPFLSPLFSDLVIKPIIRELQTNSYIIEATKIMVGLIPMLESNKSGNVKDQLAISPETAGKFLGLLKQGISSSIKLGAVPFEDIKVLDFKASDKSMLENYTKTTMGMTGINTRLLYSTDKMSAEETRNSISVDTYLMAYIYPYFEDFMNFYINKLTKKFKFKFKFSGSEFDADKTTRLNNAMTLADKGLFSHQLVANALGVLPQDLERMLMESKAMGWDEKLIPLLNIYNQSNDKGGRPTSEKSGKPLSDSAEITRDSASNIDKNSGKI